MNGSPRHDRMQPLERLLPFVRHVMNRSVFYAEKIRAAGLSERDFEDSKSFLSLPFTTKNELAGDQSLHPPYGRNLTEPLDTYTRLHQTSGTSNGKPLRWLDTPRSWDWLLSCWKAIFPKIGIQNSDILFFPFSFGPFLGFWTAFEAATQLGYRVIPGGGMTSTARLRFLFEHQITVVFATPTYALHLTQVAAEEGLDLTKSSVRALVVAGEPGGLIGSTRERITQGWGAKVYDHYGMTEVGPVAIEPENKPGGLDLLAEHYFAEVLEPNGTREILPGEVGELVLTNLGRWSSPVIRYRTGDLVRLGPAQTEGMRFEGGILGRVDDMIHVRGNNLYPSALEAIVRRFPSIVEFRIIVDQTGPLTDLRLQIEPASDSHGSSLAEEVAQSIQDELLFRTHVETVASGTLPRFEMKSRRVVRNVRDLHQTELPSEHAK